MRVPAMNAWNRFWFRKAAPLNLIAARIIISLNALWLVLSRPNLPEIVSWPGAFWRHADVFIRARFFIGPMTYALEMALYVVLVVALLLVVAGRAVRPSAFIAGLLIFHFAPFEDIFTSTGGPFFRGFTLLVSGLLIVAFAQQPRRNDEPSSEYRWPLVLIQLLFSFTYLMSGISKLRLTGAHWATAQNFEGLVLGMVYPDAVPPLAHWFIGHAILCWLGAMTGVAMDFLFVTAVFSRRMARIVVPLTFIAHVAIAGVMGVVFLGWPALLLFVNWEWLIVRLHDARFAPSAAISQ